MRAALLLFLGINLVRTLPAQTAFAGPIVALTYDAPTRSLRAVNGLPGSSSFGPALMDNVYFASLAPGQNYGLAFQDGKWLFVSGLGSTSLSRTAISGIDQYPDGIVWSGSGSVAILYSISQGWFQTVSGFPNAPVAAALVSVSSLAGSFSAIATNGTGSEIAVAASGDSGAVYQYSSGQFNRLASMSNPLSLSFSTNSQTLFALDGSSQDVFAITVSSGGIQTLSLPGLGNPIAIQASTDSQNRPLLYIASASDHTLRILDTATLQILNDVSLSVQPTGLAPFGTNSFVLVPRTQSSNPLWLFSIIPQPGAFFVPAIQQQRPVHRNIVNRSNVNGGTR
jgi:hypothetical protein